MKRSFTTWEAIFHFLEGIGTDVVFGLPSDDLNMIHNTKKPMYMFLTKDQRNALFMAAGHARITGRPAVAMVGKGPAFTNTMTGLLEAKHLGVPLLLIGVGTGSDKVGTKSFQEFNQMAMVDSVVKWSYRVEHPERLIWALEQAVFIAVNGGPGPVYLEIPEHLFQFKMEWDGNIHSPRETSVCSGDRELRESLRLIQEAKRPILLLGGGVQSRRFPLPELAEKLGAAVFVTASGRGCIDESHPLFCGVSGLYTVQTLRPLWQETDLVISLGSRLEETATFGWKEGVPVLQVNKQLEDFQLQYRGLTTLSDVGVIVDVWLNLLEIKGDPDRDEWRERIVQLRREAHDTKESYRREFKEKKKIHVAEILAEMENTFEEGMVLVQENGLHDMWSYFYPYFQLPDKSVTVSPSEQTPLGFGVAAAVGARLANPDQPIVAFVGDGAFNMFQVDFSTLIEQRIPVIYIVLNNGGYGWLEYQLRQNPKSDYTFVSKTFSQSIFPERQGVEIVRVSEKSELASSLQLAYQLHLKKKPVCLLVETHLDDVPAEIKQAYGDFPVLKVN